MFPFNLVIQQIRVNQHGFLRLDLADAQQAFVSRELKNHLVDFFVADQRRRDLKLGHNLAFLHHVVRRNRVQDNMLVKSVKFIQTAFLDHKNAAACRNNFANAVVFSHISEVFSGNLRSNLMRGNFAIHIAFLKFTPKHAPLVKHLKDQNVFCRQHMAFWIKLGTQIHIAAQHYPRCLIDVKNPVFHLGLILSLV